MDKILEIKTSSISGITVTGGLLLFNFFLAEVWVCFYKWQCRSQSVLFISIESTVPLVLSLALYLVNVLVRYFTSTRTLELGVL